MAIREIDPIVFVTFKTVTSFKMYYQKVQYSFKEFLIKIPFAFPFGWENIILDTYKVYDNITDHGLKITTIKF